MAFTAITMVALGMKINLEEQLYIAAISGKSSLNLALTSSVFPPLVAGAVFGIIPDLDQIPLVKKVVQHRSGLSHSLITLLWLPLLIGFFIPEYLAFAAAAIFSHWFIDSFNPTGVRTIPYILPRKKEGFMTFFTKHERDLRFATLRYDNHVVNIIVCAICVVLVGLLSLV
jgi:membrane-bound metal-dependent hydrolase YbcI (DUF457 family)